MFGRSAMEYLAMRGTLAAAVPCNVIRTEAVDKIYGL